MDKKFAIAALLAGTGCVMGLTDRATAATATIDGTLDASYGAALSTQTQVTNAPPEFTDPSNARSATYSQLSAAYGIVDATNHKFDLFLAGSLNLAANTSSAANGLVLALQTNATGVHSLAGQNELPSAGNATSPLSNVTFDTGFAPQALFTFEYNGGIASDFYNLTTATHVAADLNPASGSTASMSTVGGANGTGDSFNSAHTYGYDQTTAPGSGNPTQDFAGERTRSDTGAPTYSIAVNNGLDRLMVGSGSAANPGRSIPADPGFANATDGTEFQFNLTSDPTDTTGLYYTGGPINVSAFLVDNGFSSITNQVLGAASATSSTDAVNNPQFFGAGVQFTDPTLYAGNQFFAVPGTAAAVPEPASLGLIGAAGATLLTRRRRR